MDDARGMFGGNNSSRKSGKVSQHKPLFFSVGFGILPSRAKSTSRKKEGGSNDFVRPPFFITNSKESR